MIPSPIIGAPAQQRKALLLLPSMAYGGSVNMEVEERRGPRAFRMPVRGGMVATPHSGRHRGEGLAVIMPSLTRSLAHTLSSAPSLQFQLSLQVLTAPPVPGLSGRASSLCLIAASAPRNLPFTHHHPHSVAVTLYKLPPSLYPLRSNFALQLLLRSVLLWYILG
jgi:hypothetical protein